MFSLLCQARSDRMTAVTTEDPKMSEQSAALTVNMTDSESSSGENDSTELGEDEIEDPDSEFIRFTKQFILQPIVQFSFNTDSDSNATHILILLFHMQRSDIHMTGRIL